MSIRHYGLDAAEIEALEAQGKTDDEINAANEKRIKEQLSGDSKNDDPMDEFLAELKANPVPESDWITEDYKPEEINHLSI